METGQNKKKTRIVRAGRRSYFFDLRTDKNGASYLSISEVVAKNPEEKIVQRNSIYVHEDDFMKFISALLKMMAENNIVIGQNTLPPSDCSEMNQSFSEKIDSALDEILNNE